MTTNSVLVSGTIVETQAGVQVGPFLITGATQPGPGAESTLTVTTGNNAVTVPTAARGVILVPTSVTSSPLLLKGATSADAGLPISSSQPSVITFDPNNLPATLNVNSTTTAGTITLRWF